MGLKTVWAVGIVLILAALGAAGFGLYVFISMWLNQKEISIPVERSTEADVVNYLINDAPSLGAVVAPSVVNLDQPFAGLVINNTTDGLTVTEFPAGSSLTSRFIGTWSGDTKWEYSLNNRVKWDLLTGTSGITTAGTKQTTWKLPDQAFSPNCFLRVTALSSATSLQLISLPFTVRPAMALVDWGTPAAQNVAAGQLVRINVVCPFLLSTTTVTQPVYARVDYLTNNVWTPMASRVPIVNFNGSLYVETTTPSTWQPSEAYSWRVKTLTLVARGYPEELSATTLPVNVVTRLAWTQANYVEGWSLTVSRSDNAAALSLAVNQSISVTFTKLRNDATVNLNNVNVLFQWKEGAGTEWSTQTASFDAPLTWTVKNFTESTGAPSGFYTLSVSAFRNRDTSSKLAEVIIPVVTASFNVIDPTTSGDTSSTSDDVYVVATSATGAMLWSWVTYIYTVGQITKTNEDTSWTNPNQWVLASTNTNLGSVTTSATTIQRTGPNSLLSNTYRLSFMGTMSSSQKSAITDSSMVDMELTFAPVMLKRTVTTKLRKLEPLNIPTTPELDGSLSVALTVSATPKESTTWPITVSYKGPVRFEYMERLKKTVTTTSGKTVTTLDEGPWKVCNAITVPGNSNFNAAFSYDSAFTFDPEQLVPNTTDYPTTSPLNSTQMALRIFDPLNGSQTWQSPLFSVIPSVSLAASSSSTGVTGSGTNSLTYTSTLGATLTLTLSGVGKRWYKDMGLSNLRFQWLRSSYTTVTTSGSTVTTNSFTLSDAQLLLLNCCVDCVAGTDCNTKTSSSADATMANCLSWTNFANVTAPSSATDFTWSIHIAAVTTAPPDPIPIRIRLLVDTHPCGPIPSENSAAYVKLCSTTVTASAS